MKITLIEILIGIAVACIVASLVFNGVEKYKADHAHDSKPVVEFIK